MSFGDFMGLVAAMGGLVAIVAILGQGYRRRLEHKERIAELRVGTVQTGQSDARTEVIEKLEHRLRVLERIATDKSGKLAAEIEDLRESADAR